MLAACSGIDGGGSFDDALHDGASCARLSDLRNEQDPGSPDVDRMNEHLREVGCFTSTATRTDQ